MLNLKNSKIDLGLWESVRETPTRSVVTDSRATLRGPTPPFMAASGLGLGLGTAHGQNGHGNVKNL